MISVIIPLYNKEAIILQSLRSVLNQDYEDFEVLVVNDGSTDCSVEIVRQIEDPRVRLIEQSNAGPSAARNRGIRESNGDWLCFLDADDELEPGALSHFANLSVHYPDVEMFLGEVYKNDGVKKEKYVQYKEGVVKNMFKSFSLGKIMQCSGSSIYRRTICEQHLYDERLRRYEDLECLFRKYRVAKTYTTSFPVASVNIEYASASKGKNNISEDFMGHLDLTNKTFWEKMALYELFLGERPLYPEQCRRLYPQLYQRYDLLLCHKFIGWLKSLGLV